MTLGSMLQDMLQRVVPIRMRTESLKKTTLTHRIEQLRNFLFTQEQELAFERPVQ